MSFLIDEQKGTMEEFFLNTTGRETNQFASHDSHGSLARSLSIPLSIQLSIVVQLEEFKF